MRYVEGPSVSSVSVPARTATPPTGLPDLQPTVTADGSGAAFVFPAYDPAAATAPAEVRAYWLFDGSPNLTLDPDSLVASNALCSTAAVEVPAEGHSVTLPTPDAAFPPLNSPPAAYIVRTVLGFAS